MARRVFLLLSLALLLGSGPASHAEKLFVGDVLGQVVLEVDIPTGDRRLFELEDYPQILSARMPVPESPDRFLYATFDAGQRTAIHRFDAPTMSYSGVSGFIDYNSDDSRGTGPGPNLGFSDMILTREGTLAGLLPELGPMEIDLETGDRRLLANDINPVTGANPPMLGALDLVWESSRTLLVADRFQGIFRMDRETGDLELAHPTSEFLSPPYNIDRLPSGRLVHALSQGNVELYVFDPESKEDRILSSGGPFPIGTGEPFLAVWDIAVDGFGSIFVYDLGYPAIFEVNMKNGDRTIVSGPDRGEGPELLDGFNAPTLSAISPPPSRGTSFWLVR